MKKISSICKITCSVILLSIFINANGQTTSIDNNRKIIFLCPPCGLDCDTIQFSKPGTCPNCGMSLFASYKAYANKTGTHAEKVNKNVAVLLFPGVEIIDFAGPWEVFGAAGMNVYSVSENESAIETSMNLKIKPDYTFTNAPNPDILLIPGGNVDPSDSSVMNWIKKVNGTTEHTLSVCTGAFYLASAGILDNLKATTNYPALSSLKSSAPHAIILDSVRYADNGHIITSAGLSSGIDAALHVVSLYLGKAQTKKMANELEYNWNDETTFVRGNLADRNIQGMLEIFTPFDYTLNVYNGDENKWAIELSLQTTLSYEDLKKLILYQFEQVNGWKKMDKREAWSLDVNGKKWIAELNILRAVTSAYKVQLNVKRAQ